MRYVVSCQRCRFNADANDIRGVGLQVNTHAWNCADDPVLVIEAGEPEHCEVESKVTELTLLMSK
jgi:hypothetical protein